MLDRGDYVIGVDLGATKILAAAFQFEADGSLRGSHAETKLATPRGEGAEGLVGAIVTVVEALREKAGHELGGGSCRALGVAVPAPLDRAKGVVLYTANLGLENYPLAAELRKRLGVEVSLENDVQAGVYGELRAGALRGKRNAVGIFIGTGIGGGIVIDGELYRGSSGSAGEIGHMIVHEGGPLCGCGNYGCLEAHSSRTALTKDAIALAASGKAPGMAGAAGLGFRKYRSAAFAEAVEAGDEAIARAIDRGAFWLGVGMANLVNILNPEAIVLGGGMVGRFGKRYLAGARTAMAARLMPGLDGTVEVLLSELGDLAGPVGVALIAWSSLVGEEGPDLPADGKKKRK